MAKIIVTDKYQDLYILFKESISKSLGLINNRQGLFGDLIEINSTMRSIEFEVESMQGYCPLKSRSAYELGRSAERAKEIMGDIGVLKENLIDYEKSLEEYLISTDQLLSITDSINRLKSPLGIADYSGLICICDRILTILQNRPDKSHRFFQRLMTIPIINQLKKRRPNHEKHTFKTDPFSVSFFCCAFFCQWSEKGQ